MEAEQLLDRQAVHVFGDLLEARHPSQTTYVPSHVYRYGRRKNHSKCRANHEDCMGAHS